MMDERARELLDRPSECGSGSGSLDASSYAMDTASATKPSSSSSQSHIPSRCIHARHGICSPPSARPPLKGAEMKRPSAQMQNYIYCLCPPHTGTESSSVMPFGAAGRGLMGPWVVGERPCLSVYMRGMFAGSCSPFFPLWSFLGRSFQEAMSLEARRPGPSISSHVYT
ncbi:uncharacterized protein BKA78DRAFT_91572 [Phyllosticta capitalensis]|uniref:uncharacterized protein n=1 Tax=Phyllosticta capitalensis TaxID=121624 RepID=UPI003130B163